MGDNGLDQIKGREAMIHKSAVDSKNTQNNHTNSSKMDANLTSSKTNSTKSYYFSKSFGPLLKRSRMERLEDRVI